MVVHWIVRRVPTYPARELTAAATGAAIGLGSAAFELAFIPRFVRALPMGGLLLVRTFFYVTLCAVAIHAVTGSLLGIFEHGGPLGYYRSEQYRDFVLGGRFVLALVSLTLASFFINFVRQLNRMLGPGTLMNLLLGRYHRPVAEDRIFMFLDLNDSTAIAESLGPLRFNDFKNDFFYDVAEPVLQTRGQIYQYVGDEVVVTWTTERGLARATACAASFSSASASTSTRIGISPSTGSCPSSRRGCTAGRSSPRRSATSRRTSCTAGTPSIRQLASRRSVGRWSGASWSPSRCCAGASCPRSSRQKTWASVSSAANPARFVSSASARGASPRVLRWRHSGCEGAAGAGCGVRGTTRRQVVLDRPWLGSTSRGAHGNRGRERVHGPHTLPRPPPRNPGRELLMRD